MLNVKCIGWCLSFRECRYKFAVIKQIKQKIPNCTESNIHCLFQQSRIICVVHIRVLKNIWYLQADQQMHILKYAQSHTIVLHQHVSVTPVTISCCFITRTQSNTNNCTKMFDKTTWLHTLFFCGALYGHKISNYIVKIQ